MGYHMEKTENYLQVLEQSLEKKKRILQEIVSINEIQKNSVSGDKMDEETFDKSIADKDLLIEQINKLDEGFSTVYDRVRDYISSPDNKEKNKELIQRLQNLITKVTDLSMKVSRQEKENQTLVMKKLSDSKKEVVQARSRSKAASSYYNNMNKMNYVDPQFMDHKK